MIYERLPYKEVVTGSNAVAPTRVFQKSSKKIPINAQNNIILNLLRIVSKIKFISG